MNENRKPFKGLRFAWFSTPTLFLPHCTVYYYNNHHSKGFTATFRRRSTFQWRVKGPPSPLSSPLPRSSTSLLQTSRPPSTTWSTLPIDGSSNSSENPFNSWGINELLCGKKSIKVHGQYSNNSYIPAIREDNSPLVTTRGEEIL